MPLNHPPHHSVMSFRRSPPAPPGSTPRLNVFQRDCLPSSACVNIPPCPPCKSNEQCEQISRSCNSCQVNQCVVKIPGASSSGGGSSINIATLGGILGGVLSFLVIGAIVFYFWRKKRRTAEAARRAAVSMNEKKKKKADGTGADEARATKTTGTNARPANANVPPPPRVMINGQPSEGAHEEEIEEMDSVAPEIGHRPLTQRKVYGGGQSASNRTNESDPFSDDASVASSGTNIIPIAYMPPSSSSTTQDAKRGPFGDVVEHDLQRNGLQPSVDDVYANKPSGLTRNNSKGPISPSPSRPQRSANLNLRLPDEDGKKDKRRSDGSSLLSPAIASSLNSPTFADEQNSFLNSDPHRMSTSTVMSTATYLSTGTMQYMPTIVTPKRVQVGQAGPATIVRSLSQIKREQAAAASAANGSAASSPSTSDSTILPVPHHPKPTSPLANDVTNQVYQNAGVAASGSGRLISGRANGSSESLVDPFSDAASVSTGGVVSGQDGTPRQSVDTVISAATTFGGGALPAPARGPSDASGLDNNADAAARPLSTATTATGTSSSGSLFSRSTQHGTPRASQVPTADVPSVPKLGGGFPSPPNRPDGEQDELQAQQMDRPAPKVSTPTEVAFNPTDIEGDFSAPLPSPASFSKSSPKTRFPVNEGAGERGDRTSVATTFTTRTTRTVNSVSTASEIDGMSVLDGIPFAGFRVPSFMSTMSGISVRTNATGPWGGTEADHPPLPPMPDWTPSPSPSTAGFTAATDRNSAATSSISTAPTTPAVTPSTPHGWSSKPTTLPPLPEVSKAGASSLGAEVAAAATAAAADSGAKKSAGAGDVGGAVGAQAQAGSKTAAAAQGNANRASLETLALSNQLGEMRGIFALAEEGEEVVD